MVSQNLPKYSTHSLLINVDLDELDAGVLGLKLGEVGADELAGAAPGGPVVDNDGLGAGDLKSVLLSSFFVY